MKSKFIRAEIPYLFQKLMRFFPLVLCNFPGCVRKMGNLVQIVSHRRQLLYELDVGGIRARANLVTDKQLPNDRLPRAVWRTLCR